MDVHDRFRGCLLAGAVGDARGAPVEFWSLGDIRARLGPDGVTGHLEGEGAVTDDTQMALFVADPEEAFRLGCGVAALTHGHRSGWLPAGVLAATLALVVDGADLADALDAARPMLEEHRGHEETAAALDAALALAPGGHPDPERLEALGGAWVGEEALAIAVCCALAAPGPRAALLAAVNHSGGSDSTGAICGNLVGAVHGTAPLPAEWVAALDVGDLVARVADDLWRERFSPPTTATGEPTAEWWVRYPGW